MKTICLYHRSDLDGHCSGAIVKHFVPDAELIGVEYGDKLLESEEFRVNLAGARVYLVDFSLQPWDRMQQLASEAGELIWIDHHKSAIEEMESKGWGEGKNSVTATLDQRFAACELCWMHFHMKSSEWTGDPLSEHDQSFIPRAVRLLGRYDIWDHAYSSDVLPFQWGCRLEDTDPKRGWSWSILFNEDSKLHDDYIQDTIADGEKILDYQAQQNARLMGISFVHTWKGFRWLCVNVSGTNSMAFDSKFDPELHDGVMSFFYAGDNGHWKFSMYSPDQKHDFSVIAKEMGGGGHPAACGFQVKDLAIVLPICWP